MNKFNLIQKNESKETPIFSLSLSVTGSKLTADADILNTLIAAGIDTSPDVQAQLREIQDEFLQTHKRVTERFENVLSELFGAEAIAKSETQSVCASTAFYIGGEPYEDE